MAKAVRNAKTDQPKVAEVPAAPISTEAGGGPAASSDGRGPSTSSGPTNVAGYGEVAADADHDGAAGLEGVTPSTDAPREPDQSGAGSFDKLGTAGPAAREFSEPELQWRRAFPKTAEALDKWHATGAAGWPTGFRITARRDGFRRAGIAHSATPTDHPLERFRLPEEAEALLAEPNLIVELI